MARGLAKLAEDAKRIISSAASSASNFINKPRGPNQVSIKQAASMTAPTVARDFGLALQGKDRQGNYRPGPNIGKIPIVKNVTRMAANTGQSIGSGVVDLARAAYKIPQPGVSAGEKVKQLATGAYGAAKIASAGTPVFQAANVLTQAPNSLVKRVSAGIIRGQTGVKDLAEDVKAKNMKIKVFNQDVEFDPAEGVGQMIGFVKNPLNSKIFKATEGVNLIPGAKGVAGKAANFLLTNITRGGTENVLMSIKDLPSNVSAKEKAKFVLDNFAMGAASETLFRGGSEGLQKVMAGTISKLPSGKLAQVFDYLKSAAKPMFRDAETGEIPVTKNAINNLDKYLRDSKGRFVSTPIEDYVAKLANDSRTSLSELPARVRKAVNEFRFNNDIKFDEAGARFTKNPENPNQMLRDQRQLPSIKTVAGLGRSRIQPAQAFGLAGGITPEYDEEGKLTGVGYNPVGGVAGIIATNPKTRGMVTKAVSEAGQKLLPQLDDVLEQELKPAAEAVTDSAREGVENIGEQVSSNINKYAGNINLNRMDIDDNSKKVLDDAVGLINQEATDFRGKPLTHEETLEAAKASDLLTKAIPREQTEALTGAITRLRQEVAKGASDGKLTADFIDNVRTLQSFAADSGRRLNAFKINADPEAMTIQEQLVRHLTKLGNDTDAILKAAEGIDFDDAKQVTQFYRQFVKPTFGEIVDEYRFINMLSSPKTNIVNAFGNLLQTAVLDPGTKLYSGAIDAISSTLTGAERQRYVREVPAYYRGAFSSVGDAVKNAASVMRGEKFSTRPDLDRLPSGKLGALEFFPRILEASDILFNTIIKGGEKESLAYRALRSGEEMSPEMIDKLANEQAQYFTFHKQLDPENKSGQGTLLSKIDDFTTGIYQLRDKPLVKWFIPFIQTPMNILKQGIEYSPAGIATLPGAADKQEQLAKALLGSTVFLGAAYAAQKGDATWAAPTGEKERKAFYDSGRQPYSLKVGDQWVSFSKLGPLSYPMAMAAALKNYTDYDTKRVKTNDMEGIINAMTGVLGFFGDQSYLQGIGDLVDSVQGTPGSISRVVSNIPRQLVPLAALQSWVARIIDPNIRESRDPLSSIMQGIPGVSTLLPAQQNSVGQPSERNNRIFNEFSPVAVTNENPAFELLYQINGLKKVTAAIKDAAKSGKLNGPAARDLLNKYSQRIKEAQSRMTGEDGETSNLETTPGPEKLTAPTPTIKVGANMVKAKGGRKPARGKIPTLRIRSSSSPRKAVKIASTRRAATVQDFLN